MTTGTEVLSDLAERKQESLGLRIREGRAGFDAVLTHEVAQDAGVAAAVRARALAGTAVLYLLSGAADSVDRAQQALAIARDIDDRAVLARALVACGFTAAYNAELAGAYFAEAIELARELDDTWRLSQILAWQASAAIAVGGTDRGARARRRRTRPRRRDR